MVYTSLCIECPVKVYKITVLFSGSLARPWGSLMKIQYPEPWYDPFLFSKCHCIQRNSRFIFICFYSSWCCAVWMPFKVASYIILSADYIFPFDPFGKPKKLLIGFLNRFFLNAFSITITMLASFGLYQS